MTHTAVGVYLSPFEDETTAAKKAHLAISGALRVAAKAGVRKSYAFNVNKTHGFTLTMARHAVPRRIQMPMFLASIWTGNLNALLGHCVEYVHRCLPSASTRTC